MQFQRDRGLDHSSALPIAIDGQTLINGDRQQAGRVGCPIVDVRERLEVDAAQGNLVRTIIFDFDGTIADSLEVGLRVVNSLAHDFGLAPVTKETLARWQDLSSKEILNEVRLPFFRLPLMIRRFKRDLNSEIPNLRPFEGMEAALRSLKAQGCRLGIVSSNSEDNIRRFLAVQGMEHLFEFVVSCPRLMGKDKALKKLMKHYHLHPEAVLYVGDETRDVDAAKKSNVRSAAVSWGFNSVKVLAQHRPDFVLTDPSDLVRVLTKF